MEELFYLITCFAYIKNKILRKKLREKKVFSSIVCTYAKIMQPVKLGLNKDEYIHLKEATLRYIDTVFSDKNVEKLLLVVFLIFAFSDGISIYEFVPLKLP